jgi:TRAP-type C4-dicarboxylate transport system substrate-binding protein
MSQDEVYTSLQQGVLDGAENNEFALTIARHAEVAKYYTYDRHTRIPDVLLIGTATLERLTPEQRRAVVEAAKESTAFQRGAWNDAVETARQESVEKFGVTFIEPDAAEFQQAIQPIYEELKADPDKYSVYEQIRAAATPRNQ